MPRSEGLTPRVGRGWTAVVTGIPRSGTSLLMQMLAAGGVPVLSDGARAPDADNPRGYFELESAKRLTHDRSWLRGTEGRAFKLVHALVRELPPTREFRILLARRRLVEVVRSQRAMLERRGAGGAAAPDRLSESRWIEIFGRDLTHLEEWIEAQPNFALLRVDYNALLRSPRPVAEALSRFLGGGLDVDAMQRCVDPALYRQRCVDPS